MYRAAKVALTVFILVALVSCASSEAVILKNGTGQTVQCGPYSGVGSLPAQAAQADEKLRGCIYDYQRQGYERVQ